MYHNDNDSAYFLIFVALFISAVVAFNFGTDLVRLVSHIDRESYIGTVTEKIVKRAGETDKYLVPLKLENGEIRTFEDTDSYIELKWDSTDVYARIQVGKTYRFRTYGWRWQFFSIYENILSVEEIPTAEKAAERPNP